jgi:23S rRNA (uridine2552-2'-O)-methyltransferase
MAGNRSPPVEKRKNQFNKAWMHEHVTDHYVQEAKRLGYRARAAFKLLEIDAKDALLKPGQVVVDLGCRDHCCRIKRRLQPAEWRV